MFSLGNGHESAHRKFSLGMDMRVHTGYEQVSSMRKALGLIACLCPQFFNMVAFGQTEDGGKYYWLREESKTRYK